MHIMKAALVTAVALFAISIVVAANSAYPRQLRVPTGDVDCGPFDRGCRGISRLANIDVGNPGWVNWIQHNEGVALVPLALLIWAGVEVRSLWDKHKRNKIL